MSSIVSNKLKNFFYLSAFSLLSILFYYFSAQFYLLYDQNCTNKDFLTWDPELRYILTLKMMNFIREGKIHSYIFQFLDSPHWPSLRNVLESIVFTFTGHSPVVLTLITFFFYLLLPIGALFLFWKEKQKSILSILLLTLYLLALLQADSLLLYSFTGMLEVQGAFLFIFTTYYLSKVYSEPEFIKKDSNKWLVFGSVFLLYQTKYPYGYLLVLFLFLFEVIFFPKQSFGFALEYFSSLKNIYKNPRWLIAILAILSLFLPSHLLKGKTASYLRYLFMLSLVIDFLFFFYKRSSKQSTERIEFLFKYAILPIVIWMFIHPDRFGSYSGQITHVESQGFNPGQEIIKDKDYYFLFFTEFVWNSFSQFHLGYAVLVFNLISFFSGILIYLRRKSISYSFFASTVCLFTFLELSLFTTNRLARHTYHLYPTMILSFVFFILENYNAHKKSLTALSLISVLLFSYPFLMKPDYYISRTEVCYTGYDRKDYTTPLWMESIAKEKLNRNTILFNELSPLHVNKADTEYLLSKISYDRKIRLTIDPKRKIEDLEKFDEIWIPSNHCNLPKNLEKFRSLLINQGFDLNFEKIQSSEGCILINQKK